MSLVEFISEVEAGEKTLVVHNADESAVRDVEARFADRNVTVLTASTDAGPPEYVVLSEGDRVLTGASLSAVLPEGGRPPPRTPEFARRPYRPLLDELDETTFTSYDPARMLAASREIEDRAWRTGEGRLYAGFQRYSVLADQLRAYELLGGKSGLDVAVVAVPDEPLPSHESTFEVCPAQTEEVRDVWFVAYDGGGRDDAKCALLAEERAPRRFYGFWTYDPTTVDRVFEHVRGAYVEGWSDARRTTGS